MAFTEIPGINIRRPFGAGESASRAGAVSASPAARA